MTYSAFLDLLANSNAYDWKLLPHDRGILLEEDLSIRVMRPESSDDDQPFMRDWADREARLERCTAYYGSSPVVEFDVVSVASGRALVPFAGDGVPISRAHEQVARVLHLAFNGTPNDYGHYMTAAGVEVAGEK